MGVSWTDAGQTAGIAVAVPLGLYISFLLIGAIPYFQRLFVYAHIFNTLLWDNVDKPEKWGFARNQVTPFYLSTPDGEKIYAWHVLPLPLYAKHEEEIASSREPGVCKDITKTASFRLLKDDPNAKVIIYFHGNAGHIANGWRADTYHSLTDTTSYHVLAIDYRGFGRSSGSPTEKGIILDALTAVEWVMKTAGVPSERIALFGQSLGTAVASGVAELCADDDLEFAGIILIAGFSKLPTMLTGYRISGYVPVFGPFSWVPLTSRCLQALIYEKWPSEDRLARVVKQTKTRLRLTFIHAQNDMDIPCHESDKLFRSAASATLPDGHDPLEFESKKENGTTKWEKGAFRRIWTAEPNIVILQEQFPHGGHNRIMKFAPTLLAVMRSFDEE